MEFRAPVKFREIMKAAKEGKDRDISYCVYSDIDDSDDLRLDTICYIDDYPEITDLDEEIYSEFVESHRLELLFRDELIQDVIDNALYQKPSVMDEEMMKAILYYNNYDTFMTF